MDYIIIIVMMIVAFGLIVMFNVVGMSQNNQQIGEKFIDGGIIERFDDFNCDKTKDMTVYFQGLPTEEYMKNRNEGMIYTYECENNTLIFHILGNQEDADMIFLRCPNSQNIEDVCS